MSDKVMVKLGDNMMSRPEDVSGFYVVKNPKKLGSYDLVMMSKCGQHMFVDTYEIKDNALKAMNELVSRVLG